MSADLADLDAGEERLTCLQKQAVAARDSYDKAARRLSELREVAAMALAEGGDGRTAGAEAGAGAISSSK